jgi:hypothetical protein
MLGEVSGPGDDQDDDGGNAAQPVESLPHQQPRHPTTPISFAVNKEEGYMMIFMDTLS